MTQWRPYEEPLRVTLTRTVTIALVAGAVVARRWGGLHAFPVAVVVMLWPSFGGHWIELWFLNWLRPRISSARGVQIAARVAVWFIGGIALAAGMGLTALALTGRKPIPWTSWWLGGFAFVAVELVPHSVFQMRGRPSFFNGRG